MRKLLLVIIFFLALCIPAVYLFIPNFIEINSKISIGATQPALHRLLLDENNVSIWWPGEIQKTNTRKFMLNGQQYQIIDNNISLLPVIITNKERSIHSAIYIFSKETNSLQIEWVAKIASSYNPVKRFLTYQQATRLKNDMNSILSKMQSYFSVTENIYGIAIKEALVVDANFISTSAESDSFPSTESIYSLIHKLEIYAGNNKAKQTGPPMLNINASGNHYLIKVALPVDISLPTSGDIFLKQMPKNGNILIAEVKGGNYTASKAFEEIVKYANDHQRNMPAIPYYSLVTDRTKESDTTKWITRIYCPVM
jgi:hypothetical protein